MTTDGGTEPIDQAGRVHDFRIESVIGGSSEEEPGPNRWRAGVRMTMGDKWALISTEQARTTAQGLLEAAAVAEMETYLFTFGLSFDGDDAPQMARRLVAGFKMWMGNGNRWPDEKPKGDPAEAPSTAKLIRALEEAEAPGWLLERARAGAYHDLRSDDAFPQRALFADLNEAGLTELAERVVKGEFDATEAEFAAWAESPDGQAVLNDPALRAQAEELLAHIKGHSLDPDAPAVQVEDAVREFADRKDSSE